MIIRLLAKIAQNHLKFPLFTHKKCTFYDCTILSFSLFENLIKKMAFFLLTLLTLAF